MVIIVVIRVILIVVIVVVVVAVVVIIRLSVAEEIVLQKLEDWGGSRVAVLSGNVKALLKIRVGLGFNPRLLCLDEV